MRIPTIVFSVPLLVGPLLGQTLVKDVNPNVANAASTPANLVAVGGTVYFAANDGVNGLELWKSDGTTAGTVLVKDINPTAATGSSISGITAFGGGVVFSANDGVAGVELWKSDGTAAGTVLVANLNPGLTSASPASLKVSGGKLYFAANDGTTGTELWSYDGTTVSQVKDIVVGTGSSSPTLLTDVGGTLYFRATESATGTELYKSDGTAAGTGLVLDINTGTASSTPGTITPFGSKVIFAAITATNGSEPWISDGTAAGTFLLLDVYPGTTTSTPTPFVVNGTRCYFTGNDGTATVGTGRELYVTDGTVAGTSLVVDFAPGTASGATTTSMVAFGAGVLYTITTSTTSSEIGFSDGTALGTTLVKDLNPGTLSSLVANLTNVGGTVYFAATNGVLGTELWKTDGTAAGTVQVKDILTGSGSSSPANFTPLGAGFVFTAADEFTLNELWISDGTTAGTTLLKDVNTTGSTPANGAPTLLTRFAGKVYFSANDGVNGFELWSSDGTGAGTSMVKDINPGAASASPSNLTVLGTRLLFTANDGTSGIELWATDGTAAGTVLLMDINPGSANASPALLTVSGSRAFFTALAAATGSELYVTDGTSAGTQLVTDLNAGTLSGVTNVTGGITPFGAGVMFRGDNGTTGTEPYVSDGTAAGTTLVADINPTGGSSPFPMKNIGGVVYMQASDGVGSFELWKSDGTVSGTVLVKDINTAASTGSFPANFTEFQGKVVFTANEGSTAPASGSEIWISDGTTAGTQLLKDTAPGTASGSPTNLVVAGSALFFTALDPAFGRELWVSDGTTAGTVQVADVLPGTGAGITTAPVALGVGTRVVANMTDGTIAPGFGNEMWVSDGTAAGTTRIFDLNAGILSSTPSGFTQLGENLLFAATTAATGTELWSIPLATLGASEVELFGAKCVGTGTATIGTSGGAPFVGNAAFSVTLTNAAPTAPAAVFLNNARGDLPIGACTIYPSLVPTIQANTATDASGAAAVNLPIPAGSWNIGIQLYFQWVVVEAGGPLLGVASTSQGLRIRTGGS